MPRERTEREDDGEILVRAVVHARLLGLRILSLDARVVVARPPGPTTALGASTRQDVVPIVGQRSSRGTPPQSLHRDGTSDAGLSRALELLADGTETLERSRRLTARTTRARTP
jgi:hypothetical protein